MDDVSDLGGVIAEESGGIMISTDGAVIPSDFVTAVFEQELSSGLVLPLVGVQIEGRINRTEDKVRFLLVFDTDAAASLITGIITEAGKDIERREPMGDQAVANGFGAQFKVALDNARDAVESEEAEDET